jgi:hypothetical protein
VELRLGGGHGGPAHRAQTDPQTGAYVIDLGSLTKPEYARLQNGLEAQNARKPVVTVRRLPRTTARAPNHTTRSASGTNGWPVPATIVALIAALLFGGSGVFFLFRRRRSPARS